MTTQMTMSSERVPLPPFEHEWAKKEAAGYIYGRDALENVKFGYEIARAAIESLSITEADCAYCGGTGEYFGHAPGCDNDSCALAGGIDDCDGQVQICSCAITEGEVEQRARELYAAELEANDQAEIASMIRAGGDGHMGGAALNAVIAALSLPSTVRGEVLEEAARVADHHSKMMQERGDAFAAKKKKADASQAYFAVGVLFAMAPAIRALKGKPTPVEGE